MRRYAFLQCIRCRHFHPKSQFLAVLERAPAFATGAYIGICKAGDPPEWIVWQSLEWAANRMGLCPDRDPLPLAKPECPFYDTTVTSSVKHYPETCVYHGTAVCPRD